MLSVRRQGGMPMTEKRRISVPRCNESAEHLPLPGYHGAYKSLHILTMLSDPRPISASMLADAPLPRGSGADLTVVGTLSEGCRTVRYLAALPRRVRSMGRTV